MLIGEDLLLTQVIENHFHQFSDTDEEKDTKRIVVVILPPFISLPLAHTQQPYFLHFYTILQKIDKEIGHSEVIILNNLGSAVPKRM